MTYLLDTNVVSEWVKPTPDPGVIAWLAAADEDRLFLSVVTLAELRHGVERLAAGRRRDRLHQWLRDELPARFEGRLVPIDERVADAWGRLVAAAQAVGRPLGVMDAFIGATAHVAGLTLVTRNVEDFSMTDIRIYNPWTA